MSRYEPPAPKKDHRKPKTHWLSTKQAAAYLGLSIRTIHNYRVAGKIKGHRMGERVWKYDPVELDEFIEKSTRASLTKEMEHSA